PGRNRPGAGAAAAQRRHGPLDLLRAAAGPSRLLRRAGAGGDGHLPGGPERLPDLAGLEAGAPGRADAADGLRLAGHLDDVGVGLGRVGLCSGGPFPAVVAERKRPGERAVDPVAVLVHGTSRRLLLAVAGVRVVVHDAAGPGRGTVVQRVP